MKNSLEGCLLPEDRLYSLPNDLWFKPLTRPSTYVVGVVTPFLHFAGRPRRISVKPVGSLLRKNTSLALYISLRMEGALTAPVDCRVLRTNDEVANPEVVAEDPYERGWLAELECLEQPSLAGFREALDYYSRVNADRGVVCFDVVPHHELKVFGETCEGILTQMGDFMELNVKTGDTLHVITADPATEVDMISWAEKTGHVLLGLKRTGRTLHALYRKMK
ncbi:MAG: hypothetical protein QXX49_02535 [Candidatus Caldarchaeum sp.]